MSKKIFQTLRGYNGVQNLSPTLNFDGVDVEATGVWRGGDGVSPELGPQLLQDGDMEDPSTTYWTAGAGGILSKDTTFPVQGLRCMRVANGGTPNPSAVATPFEAGKRYIIRGYARGDGVSSSPQVRYSGGVIYTGGVSTNWVRFSRVIEPTGVGLFLYSIGMLGWCEFDEIEVYEVTTMHPGQLPGLVGDTLYSTYDATPIDWTKPAYGNLAADYGVGFNNDQFLSADNYTFADADKSELVFEVVGFWDGQASSLQILAKKSASSSGYGITISNTGVLILNLVDGGTSRAVQAPSALEPYSIFHFMVFADVGSATGNRAYLAAIPGSAADLSALSSLISTEPFAMGAASDGSAASASTIVYGAVWITDTRFPLGGFDGMVLDRFNRYLGIRPDRSDNGVYLPDSSQFDTTFIEQYDDATGVTHAHKTSSNYATIGKWLDNNGLVFYGIRLAPEAENLFTYSNDLATGWALVNASMYTSDLVETPTPNIFAQGVIPSAALVAHYASYIKNIADTGDYCFSGYIREGNAGYAYLTAGPNSAYFCFDLGGFTNVVGFSRVDAVDMGGGWWLFFVVLNVAATGNVEFRIYPSDNFVSPTYLGDGVTPAIWVSFLQLEAGIIPTPRILTAGSTESRAADLISYTVDVPDRFWMTFEMVSPYGPNANAEQWVLDMATVRVYLTPSGQLSVGGEVTTTTDVCDGAQHLISIEVNQTNVTAVSISLYVDDVLEDTTAVATSLFGSYATLSAQEPRGDAGSTVWVRDLQIFDSPPQAKVFGPGGRQEGDVLLYQTTDEGEINVADGITELTPDFRTMIYLSLFGGNEDDAGGDDTTNTWWGNYGESDAAYQYRSETQHLLQALPATSSNLKRIADAVKRDLNRDFIATGIADGADVEVSIPALNKVSITGNISISDNPVYFEYTENWNASQ